MHPRLSRRGFLTSAGLGVAAAIADPAATTAAAALPEPTPHQALELLRDGNRRWVTGRVTHPHQSIARRIALRHFQNPSRRCSRASTRASRRSSFSTPESVTWL